ncbi:DnaB-like helicase C-terminal domain-containing protein [Paenibacillus pabuli]|uniref:DnaB-like helicase C-terminal domain-containing protein n=1 Tax=Paenibacillus pabuli TaxID=1472 RepID=UPI003242A790
MVITEEDIFPYIIRGEGKDYEAVQDMTIYFIQAVPHNIFTKQWHILYDIIQNGVRFSKFYNNQQANQIMKRAVSNYVTKPEIQIKDVTENYYDEKLAADDLYGVCTNTWLEMSDEVLDVNDFKANLDLYIETWAAAQYQKIHVDAYAIMSKEMRVGREIFYGLEGSKRYYSMESTKVETILNASKRTTSRIYVAPEGYESYQKNKENSPITHVLTHTGVKSIDKVIGGIRKSDLMAVIAFSGHGKTRFVSNMVYNAMMLGQHGVYYCLESETNEYIAKLIARHLAEKYNNPPISDTDIIQKRYPNAEIENLVHLAEYDLFNNEAYGKVEFIPGPLYIEDFQSGIEAIWNDRGRLDFVVIDHTGLVQSHLLKTKKEMLDWFYPQLKIISGSFMGEGIGVVCAHQLNRETHAELLKAEDDVEVATDQGAADSIEVIRSSSLAITIFCEPRHKDTDTSDILCAKMRNGKGFRRTKVYAQMGNCLYRDLPQTAGEATYTL